MFDLQGYGWMLVVGTQMTAVVSVLSFAVAVVLGFVAGTAKLGHSRIVRTIAGAYTTVIRGVPELVLLLLIFYGGPTLLQKLGWDLQIDAFPAGVGTIGFVYGAYAAEVFRGAILAVPKGQIEAAKACGMSRMLILRRILLPQVWRFALPGLGNVWLLLLKATAIISIIGLEELTRRSYIAAGSTHLSFVFYGAAAIIYLALTAISMAVLQVLERHVNRGVRRA